MSGCDSKRFLTRSGLLLLFLTCQSVGFTLESSAADKARELTSAELVESLRAAKVVDPSYSLSATRIGDLELITTEKNPKLDDKGTKVQAVLIAKTAFDLLPAGVQRNKLIFHDLQSGMFSEVVVNRTEISSYGKGRIDEKTLLSSLQLDKKLGDDAPPVAVQAVVDGPLKPERTLLLSNIEFLKSKGANLNKVDDMFAEQEKEAEAGHLQAVQTSLKQIWSIVNEQRAMLKSAQAAATGNGIGHSVSVSSGKSALNLMMIQPLMKYLSSRGVNVDQEQDTLTKLNSLPRGAQQKINVRMEVLKSLQVKFSKLSKADQQVYFDALGNQGQGIDISNKAERQERRANQNRGNGGKGWRSHYRDPNAN